MLDKLEIWFRQLKKLSLKKKLIIFGLAICCILGGIGFTNHYNQLQTPLGKQTQINTLIAKGDFRGLSKMASSEDFFACLDLLGEDASELQKKNLAKTLYANLETSVKKQAINKGESKAVVTVVVKNTDVYQPALDVEISQAEMKDKTVEEQKSLLVHRAEEQISRVVKGKKKTKNTLQFLYVKDKSGNWVLDASDFQNQMSLLGFLGMKVDNYDFSSVKNTEETKNTKKKETETSPNTTQETKTDYDTSLY